ncbi:MULTISPECIES: HAD hydrolase family protein [Shewanella]|uniref:HAD hydrolase family protein n=1 Tax=Shewanella TaxID=22 RepID=UPI00128C12D4|nr:MULTISPECIES: HAD hydrolase family protein [Shewanella]
MINLLIPIAGQSSRFPDMKPKWMLTHPMGYMMVVEAIKGINFEEFDHIYFIGLKSHELQFNVKQALLEQLDEIGILEKSELILLENTTNSQPETIYAGIKQAKIKGQIIIKDSDNFFKLPSVKGNAVAVSDLNEYSKINASNKSYVELNEHGLIDNIVEKKVVSSQFCVGAYAFEHASEFCEYFERLENDDLYISDIIFSMILDSKQFSVLKVSEYCDWGTIKEWNEYKAQYFTLFIDLDGTLVKNSGQYSTPKWGETEALSDNVQAINRLHETGKVEVIITTSRKPSFKKQTLAQLSRIGLQFDQIIYGLVHGKRIVINDYAKTNPYKSCDAINLKRDSQDLKDKLEGTIGFML